MIIFEGCDNTGKSTAVQQVLHKIPQLVFQGHSGGPPKSNEEWMTRMFGVVLKAPSETINTVTDRLFFSEMVYSKVLNRPTVTKGAMDELELRLLEHDPLIIYCRRPVHRILETFDDREQLKGVKGNVTAICREYDKVFSNGWSMGRLYVYDFEEDNAMFFLLMEIKRYLSERGLTIENNSTLGID